MRPTVVRRRVYENPFGGSVAGPSGASGPSGLSDEGVEDDESGPPSSVNVARALASLRGHELRRLDEILTHDDEEEARSAPAARTVSAEPPPASAPTVPTVRLGSSIALTELARRMSISQEELVTALVTRGFFSITVRSSLPREIARAGATIFGWEVEETNEAERAPEEKQRPKPVATPSRLARKAKSKKSGVKPKRIAKSAAQPKSAKPKGAAKPKPVPPSKTKKKKSAAARRPRQPSRRA